jgi:hypothetical protein
LGAPKSRISPHEPGSRRSAGFASNRHTKISAGDHPGPSQFDGAVPEGRTAILAGIDAAFLLAVAKPGKRLGEGIRQLVANPRPPGLHFSPQSHKVWTDDTDLLTLGFWQGGFVEPPGDSCERWSVTDREIIASTGSLRWSRQPWTPEASWAEQLRAALEGMPLRQLTHDLRGVFTIVALSSAGEGAIASDPLGFSFVYLGDNQELSAVSSRAALCAWALADKRRRPARDRLAACWPAYSRHWIGYRTGYEGVQLVRPGAIVRIASHRPPSIDLDRTPWMPSEDLRDLTRPELLELAYEELADAVRTTVTLPGGSYRADLTGGKDTRLIASVALCEGLADRFTFQTFGPPSLPDVRVATELARRFGLRHQVRFEPADHEEPFDRQIRSFVATTGGMANLWYLRRRHHRWPEIRMSGTHGLLLRSKNRVDERAVSEGDLIRGLDKMRFGAARILRPDTLHELREASVRELLDPDVEGSYVDRFDSFDLRASQRHLFGPLGDLESDVRITPLTSARLVQIAYALGGSARISELIHLELTRRYSDELAGHPFAEEKWRRPPSDLQLATATGRPTKDEAASADKVQLVQRMQVASFDERSKVLRAVLSDPHNPAWVYIDRSATIAALDRFGDLAAWERIELYGAATAAVWLGDDSMSEA